MSSDRLACFMVFMNSVVRSGSSSEHRNFHCKHGQDCRSHRVPSYSLPVRYVSPVAVAVSSFAETLKKPQSGDCVSTSKRWFPWRGTLDGRNTPGGQFLDK